MVDRKIIVKYSLVDDLMELCRSSPCVCIQCIRGWIKAEVSSLVDYVEVGVR